MAKKIGILTIVLAVFICINAQARQVYQRFSSNPIGPLNVIGIGMSESIESASLVVNATIKQGMKIPLEYPVYVDPTYKQLRAQTPVGIMFFSQSVTGATYSSFLRTELGLGDMPASIIIIDRKKRVRAFSDSGNFDWDIMGKIIEELLLNLDNKELITVGGGKEENQAVLDNIVQTDLAKQIEEEKNKKSIVIDFGASKKKWFKYLGKEIPNFKLQKLDGSGEVMLYDSIQGKVSAVIIFISALNAQVANVMPGMGTNLVIMDGFYRDFTLGEAKKGKKVVPNAFPDVPAGQSQK